MLKINFRCKLENNIRLYNGNVVKLRVIFVLYCTICLVTYGMHLPYDLINISEKVKL